MPIDWREDRRSVEHRSPQAGAICLIGVVPSAHNDVGCPAIRYRDPVLLGPEERRGEYPASMVGSDRSATSASSLRYPAMRRRISTSDETPFFDPNASQARDSGTFEACENTPPPTMKFLGACSLKRNSSPGCRARKFALPLGAQKFTSSGRATERLSNQS